MKTVKRFLWTVAAGAFAGATLSALFSPALIEWYFSPPTDLAVTCTPVVQWAISAYRKVIFTGTIMGAIVFGIFFMAFGGRGKSAKDEDKEEESPREKNK